MAKNISILGSTGSIGINALKQLFLMSKVNILHDAMKINEGGVI